MSSINSSSYYSVGGTKNSGSNGIAGMMSGMDTEAMVEKMLSGTQSKIDKQEMLKQQTTWKQDIYRDIITSVNSFYGKYFDTRYDSTLKTNFASNAFFNTMMSKVTSGNALKVISTGTDAPTGDMRVAVEKLASQASLASKEGVSGDHTITGAAITADSLSEMFDKKISFDIGTKTVNIDLNSVTNQEELLSTVQTAIAGKGATANIVNGKLRLVSDNPSTNISVNIAGSTGLGMSMTGLNPTTRTSNVLDSAGNVTNKMMNGTPVSFDSGYKFDLTLDGVTKTITLSNLKNTSTTPGTYKTDINELQSAMQKEVNKAFGSNSLDVTIKDGNRLKFSFKTDATGNTGKGHELVITGASAKKFGFEIGASSHINGGTKLNSLGLSGDRFSFSINGTDFSFKGTDTISTVMSTINNSKAGVKMTYSSLSDSFKMEATNSGSAYGIEIEQKEGALLSNLFGEDNIAASGQISSKTLTSNAINVDPAKKLKDSYATKSASMKMMVNGMEHTFTLNPKKDGSAYTKTEIEKEFNTWLGSKFGQTEIAGVKENNISYVDGNLKINDGSHVEFAASKVDPQKAKDVEAAMKSDLAYAMGLNHKATSNVAGGDTNISDVAQLKGLTLLDKDGNAAVKLSDIASVTSDGASIAAEFSNGRLNLKGTGSVTLGADLEALFGTKGTITLGDGKSPADAVTKGEDAIITVNGVKTTRNSNTFTIEGITMQITNVSAKKADGSGLEETIISSERDTDNIIDGFKSFVKDYNEMIEKLNKYTTDTAEYKKYPPLTSAQRKEMSAKEIEQWEEKSKQGLLRNDDLVGDFMASMRTLLYTKPEGSSIALYQIGIETTTNYKDGGKIEMDEAAVRNALSVDPNAVRNLFTDSVNGLSKQMMKTMDAAAKQSIANPGTLVQMAGVKGSSTEKSNTLNERITGFESRIKDLKNKYAKERQRYWNQFTTMERTLSSFNSQSMMISQQFGGY